LITERLMACRMCPLSSPQIGSTILKVDGESTIMDSDLAIVELPKLR
jgi:hypothetical protein